MQWLAAMLMVGMFAILAPHCVAQTSGHETKKSCQEIARLIVSSEAKRDTNLPPYTAKSLNCAGAHGISADATVQLTKTSWNKALQRWEFTLRCVRPHDCVPFLVWTGNETALANRRNRPESGVVPKISLNPEKQRSGNPVAKAAQIVSEALVKPGQTVTLTWDERGIRVILPVTCLDVGGMGQFVRVRLPNAPRILRAEVVGNAMLRASL